MSRTRLFKGKYANDQPLYKVWTGMGSRCYDKNAANYKYYGGRGIRICNQWVGDFMAFFTWARANGYKKGLSIDRIDNDKEYSPENCRWSTAKEQANNRRSHGRMWTNDGITQNIAKWAIQLNMSRYQINKMIHSGRAS